MWLKYCEIIWQSTWADPGLISQSSRVVMFYHQQMLGASPGQPGEAEQHVKSCDVLCKAVLIVSPTHLLLGARESVHKIGTHPKAIISLY